VMKAASAVNGVFVAGAAITGATANNTSRAVIGIRTRFAFNFSPPRLQFGGYEEKRC
jgi:hypothetical protein